jgi:hypothetical protein
MGNNEAHPVERAPITLIKDIDSRVVSAEEIRQLLDQYPQDKRLMAALLQKPDFPQHQVLSILGKMYSMDLLRIAQAPRTAPFVRQRAELTFGERFRQMQKGEQIASLKMMSAQMLRHYTNLTDGQLLSAVFGNPRCTEPLVIEILRRKGKGAGVFTALMSSRWMINLSVADMLVLDPEAPIRALLQIIPILPLGTLKKMYSRPGLHQVLRTAIEKRRDFR